MEITRNRGYCWFILIGAMITTTLAMVFQVSTASLFVVPITTALGIGRAEYAVNMSLISICGAVCQVVIGKIYTKHRVKKFQTGAFILMGLMFLLRSVATKLSTLYICSFFCGFCTAPITLANTQMLANWFKKNFGTMVSIMWAFQCGMGAIFSPLIGKIIQNQGWQTAYRVEGILLLVFGGLISLLLMKQYPADIGAKAYGEGEAVAAKKTGRAPSLARSFSMADVRTKGFLYTFLAASFLFGFMGVTGFFSHLVPAITDAYGPARAAAFLSLYSILGIVTRLLLGFIKDRCSAKVSIICSYGFFAVVCLSMFLLGNSSMFYVACFGYAVTQATGTVMATLVTAETFGTKNLTYFFGLYQTIGFIGGSIGGILAGWFFDTTGSYNSMWIAGIVITVIGVALLIFSIGASKRYAASLQDETA